MEQRELTGTVIDNQIEILESIGEGGMGAVYRAFHRGWNQPMAVKVPHFHLLAEQSERERFLLEAHTWIALGIHPHIVTCWFIHPWDGTVPLLFLDLLDGGNLRDEIRQGRLAKGDWGRLLTLAIQACDGLAHAHQLGLVHRDIKPANLLLDKSGRLCVTDFGLVKSQGGSPGPVKSGVSGSAPVHDMSITTTGSVVGTPHYASPEQWLQDDQITPRADIYSLGVVLYEMAVGQVPFDPPSGPQAVASLFVAHTTQAAPDPARLAPNIPAGLREIILSCMAKDPSQRPQTARDLRNQLSEVYRQVTGKPYPEVPEAAQPRADSLNNKAVSLWNLGKHQTAMTAWSEAMSFDALHPESVFNRAFVQWGQGKLEPEEVIRRIQTVKATHPRAAAYLGLFLLYRGQSLESEIELKTALELEENSRDPRLWKALGDCQMVSERYSEAQASYRRSLELSPQQTDVSSRLDLASQNPHPPDLDRQFPRMRPIWETVLLSAAKRVYVTPERVLCLQEEAVTALKTSDGSVEWITPLVEGQRLEVSGELNFWSREPSSKNQLFRLDTGLLLAELSDGDKLFAIHPASRKLVIGNIDLWIADLSPKRSRVKRALKLTGHDKQVSSAAFTIAGDVVVSGGYDRQLVIWSAQSGLPLHKIQRHKDFIECVAVSQDGKFAASGGRDKSVRVTTIESGENYLELKDHPAAVMAVQFSPDGKKLLAWCGTPAAGHTLLWDLTDSSLVKRFEGLGRLTHEGRYLLVPRHVNSQSLGVCDLDSLAWTRRFPSDSPVCTSDDSPDGRSLCFATERGKIGFWEFSEQTRQVPTSLHLTRTRGYLDLEATRTAFRDHIGKSTEALKGNHHKTAWVELENARALPGYYRDPQALALTSQLLKLLPRQSLRSIWEQKVVRDPSDLAIGPTLWAEDGAQAISGAGKWLRIWNPQTGSCVRGMVGHSETVTALDCYAQKALSATVGKEVRLWDLRTGECEKKVTTPSQGIQWVSLNSDLVKSVVFAQNHDLIWLDLEDGKPTQTVRLAGVSLLAATRDWNYALVGGSPGQPCLSVWNLNTAKMVADEKKFQAALKKFHHASNSKDLSAALHITALCVLDTRGPLGEARGGSPDGFGLTASQDGYIRLWDLNFFRCLREYRVGPESGAVTSLAWSKDGHHFVAGHAKGGLRVWAIHGTEGPIKAIDGHWGKVSVTALTSEARFLLTVSEDRTLRFWELDWGLDPIASSRTLRAMHPRPGFWGPPLFAGLGQRVKIDQQCVAVARLT